MEISPDSCRLETPSLQLHASVLARQGGAIPGRRHHRIPNHATQVRRLRLDRSARGVDDGHRDRDRDADDDEGQQQVLERAEATRGCSICRRKTPAS
jgi:hypothetical protein